MTLLDKVLLGTLVLGGVAIAAGIINPAIQGLTVPVEKVRTRSDMSQVAVALQLYDQEYGHFPLLTDNSRLTAVLEGVNPHKISFYSLDYKTHPDGTLLDGWKRPLTFEKTLSGFLIRSAGKDGIYNSKDDITKEVSRISTQGSK